MRNPQKITVSKEQIDYIKEQYGKIPATQIALNLNLGLSKVWKNIKALKLISVRVEKKMDDCNGFYNEKNFLLSLEIP